jgi:hypothetical protein
LVNDIIYILTESRKIATSSTVHAQTIDQKICRPLQEVFSYSSSTSFVFSKFELVLKNLGFERMKVTLAEMFSVARRAGATRLPTYLIVQPPSDPQFSEDGDQIITHPHPRSYRLGDDPLRHVGASRALPLSPGTPLSDGRPATRSAVTRPPSSPPFPSQRSLEPPTSLSTYKSRSHSSRKRPPLLSRHFRHRT